MSSVERHHFDLRVDLGDFPPDEAPELQKELEVALYDILDELGFEYQVLKARVDTVTESLAPDANHIGGFREGDPDTSRKGALDAYPRSGSQRWRALLTIHAAPDGLNYAEVESRTGIKGIWKRISELKDGGWVVARGERFIPESQSMGDVYYTTEKAEKYIKDREPATL